MVRRLLLALAAALVLSLGLGTPAAAKGPGSATISGPGIGTVELTRDPAERPGMNALLQVTRFFDVYSGSGLDTDSPEGDLGPRFDVAYDDVNDGEPFRQQLYPFATDGPVVHVPPGQQIYGMDAASGWMSADRRLTRLVERLGGTPPTVEPAVEPAAHEASTADSDPAWVVVAAGVAGAGLLVAATAVGWRRRRTSLNA